MRRARLARADRLSAVRVARGVAARALGMTHLALEGTHGTATVRETVCARGRYCPGGRRVGDMSAWNEYECPRGTFQDLAGQTACKPCGFGRYQDKEGQAACVAAELGKYGSSDAAACAAAVPRGARYLITDFDGTCTTTDTRDTIRHMRRLRGRRSHSHRRCSLDVVTASSICMMAGCPSICARSRAVLPYCARHTPKRATTRAHNRA